MPFFYGRIMYDDKWVRMNSSRLGGHAVTTHTEGNILFPTSWATTKRAWKKQPHQGRGKSSLRGRGEKKTILTNSIRTSVRVDERDEPKGNQERTRTSRVEKEKAQRSHAPGTRRRRNGIIYDGRTGKRNESPQTKMDTWEISPAPAQEGRSQ